MKRVSINNYGEKLEKWTELAESQGRTYECFLYEVEQTIKSLGG